MFQTHKKSRVFFFTFFKFPSVTRWSDNRLVFYTVLFQEKLQHICGFGDGCEIDFGHHPISNQSISEEHAHQWVLAASKRWRKSFQHQ